MKRMLILVVIAMIAGLLFAEESILIDFTTLKADISVNDADGRLNQNCHTMMDFSHVAGGSFTTQQKAVMKTSLAIENWEIVLASSSRTVENISLSYTREAPSKQYDTVMGIRVRFPTEPHNAWAIVKPPFDIPAFEPNATVRDDGTIEPEAGNDGLQSFRTGKIVRIAAPRTIADGAQTLHLGDYTFPVIRECVKDILTVGAEVL